MERIGTVSPEDTVDEQSLRDQVARSEQSMQALESDLRAIDAELEALSQRNPQYDLLSQVCCGLDDLEDLGGAHLFWGNQGGAEASAEQLRLARQRIDDFADEIYRTEEQRDAVLEKIAGQNEVLDSLHYDLRDAYEREETRKAEWLVEREANELPHRSQIMPWARGCEEDQFLRKSVLASVLVAAMIGLLSGIIDIPIPEREQLIEVPERVAKLVRQEKETPPPQPVVEEQPQIPDEVPPEPELAEEVPPEEVPESIEKPLVAEEVVPDTKEQVKSKGILAFRDSFASRARLETTAKLGSQARFSNSGETSVGRPERMMVSTSAPGSSGGINLAEISRDVGGGGTGIGGVEVGRVASSIGDAEGSGRPLSGGMSSGRTDEEIQIVFDRYKAALYRLYNRELRRDPTLRGQLVLRLTIEPDGTVSLCQLQSSDMDAPTLADQVVNRVLTFDFGAKEDIVSMTIIYPIDFLPAA